MILVYEEIVKQRCLSEIWRKLRADDIRSQFFLDVPRSYPT
jgi:hypothetical protein